MPVTQQHDKAQEQPQTLPPIAVCEAFEPLFPDESGNTGITTRYCVLTGGRGSGKSYALSLALAALLRHPGYTVLFTRWTMASARDSIIPEFRAKTQAMGVDREYAETVQDVRHRVTGSTILFRGIKTSAGNQTAKLKSLHGVNVFVLDEAEEMPDEATFDVIDLSVRDGRRPCLVILCLNPAQKGHWIHRRFWQGRGIPDDGYTGTAGDATYIHTDYRDNADNLPADYLAKAEQSRTLADPRQYRSVWLGAWMDEVVGAMWSYSMISDHRRDRQDVPTLVRVGVAIDPNVSSGPEADECGIVVAGQGTDGHYYVLADASGRIGPGEWPQVAVQQFDVHRADRVIGESNNGGELVEQAVRVIRPAIPYHAVHASRGKVTRAEPIATLYAQGLVHHVGRFPEMESEMMSYTGRDPQASPNRMDALVWVLSWLADILPGDQPGVERAGIERKLMRMGAV